MIGMDHGPWHKEWNGALGPANQLQMSPPHAPIVSSEFGTHAALHMGLGPAASITQMLRALLDAAEPEATLWDVFRGKGITDVSFNKGQLYFNFPWSSCLSLFFSLHLSSLRVSAFHGFPFTLRTQISADCPGQAVSQFAPALVPKSPCTTTEGLCARSWVGNETAKRIHTALMFKYLITAFRKCPTGDLHTAGKAHGRFPVHSPLWLSRLGRIE